MQKRWGLWATIGLVVLAVIFFVILAERGPQANKRVDGAESLPIALDGSHQNAAWSPDGTQIAFTRFRKGYNKAPADILILDLATANLRPLIEDGASNVSQPGSTWSARSDKIVFSSDRNGPDQVYAIGNRDKTDSLTQLTADQSRMAYEPSWSPDGQSFVYEMHRVDEEGKGVIVRASVGSTKIEELTKRDDDCRQPNWSPAGDAIVYQKQEGKQWDVWLYDVARKTHRRLTAAAGDKTDATFSPDGRWVVYSADGPDLAHAALFAVAVTGGQPIQITKADIYDGAPSWSPDGKYIVFESNAILRRSGLRGVFDQISEWLGSSVLRERTTTLWKIAVPVELERQLCRPGSACP